MPISFYWTRNAERLLYTPVLLLYPCYVVNMFKYWVCQSDGQLQTFQCQLNWESLVFFCISLPMLLLVPYVAYRRIKSSVVYGRGLRHENYVRSREVLLSSCPRLYHTDNALSLPTPPISGELKLTLGTGHVSVMKRMANCG